MSQEREAKRQAVKHSDRANKLAKGKQPIMTRDPMLDVPMQPNSPNQVDTAKWAT